MRIALLTSDGRALTRDYSSKNLGFGTAVEALLEGFAKIPDCEVHVLSCIQQQVTSPEKLAENIQIHSLHVPHWGWLRTGYHGCIQAVRRKLREINPDIVHGQGTERDCAISAVFSGYPNVLTIHGNMRSVAKVMKSRIGSFHWMTACLEEFSIKQSLGVLCNSAYTERLVKPLAHKTWKIPNALRNEFFESERILSSGQPPILLNIGFLSPLKEQLEILYMAKRLWIRGIKFKIHFIGKMDCLDDYGRTFSRELMMAQEQGYARHLGMLPTSQLIHEMDQASALIHAPKEEAFGLVVAEGLARNLKFFGFAIGGIIDIASGVEGAELVEPHNWSTLEESIIHWIKGGGLRPTTASREMKVRYHPKTIASKHLEIYQEVLSEKLRKT